jgi:hypothetical protein
MKISLAVLLLLGESNARRHHHRHHDQPRPRKDVANKNIDPWVYDKVYDNVNPQPQERKEGPPAEGTYTPYGNPYWPNKKD